MKSGKIKTMKYPAINKILAQIIEADMANISSDEHGFGIDVILNIMQPGERKYKHGPRIKVFKKDPDTNFSIALSKDSDDLEVIGDPIKVLRRKDLPLLLKNIKKYKNAFLMFWYDRTMSSSGLQTLMRKIDKGESLKSELDALLGNQK